MSTRTALVAGASGIVGQTLADFLVSQGWAVYGLSRSAQDRPGIRGIAADLRDRSSLTEALDDVHPTHVFITTWMRQANERENVAVNGALVRNVLDAISPHGCVEHVALVTGLKHYLGPFESYGKGVLPATPFREEQPRLDVDNFYYAQEDEVFAAARRDGFGWSVHRPHTIVGYAIGNAMNMGATLAAYATICRETGRPFRFPGSEMQWNALTDMTDAKILAHHLVWAATMPQARNEAFNVVNGDVFRWSWMWGRIADWFGIEAVPFDGIVRPLAVELADAGELWSKIAKQHDLAESRLDVLASAWHTDADLGRPIEVVTDMSKSRRLGFLEYRATSDSFYALFERLAAANIIPPPL